MPADTLESLRDAQRAFVAERDWDRFHTPKNLAAALAVEAAELLEPFQWLTAEESAQLSPAQRAAVHQQHLGLEPVVPRDPPARRQVQRTHVEAVRPVEATGGQAFRRACAADDRALRDAGKARQP